MASTATSLDPDVDPTAPAVSVPDAGDTSEGGKLKMIVQLVKKCLGVKDIASMRLSLPASLLEPIPNLEYWHYLDRPDLFAAINESEDAFERMLAAMRWAYSKDLKFIHGKVCKPYNSVLGEHFRAHWDAIPVSYPDGDRLQPPIQHLYLSPPAAESVYSTAEMPVRSETASVKSGKSAVSAVSTKSGKTGLSSTTSVPDTPTRTTPATSPDLDQQLEAELAQLSVEGGSNAATTKGLPGNVSTESVELIEEDSPTPSPGTGSSEPKRVRTTYLTEQVSHHPPVSAFYASCPTRQISMCGVDQISAKVSGTTVRVAPGSFNKGIFVNIEGGPGAGERYHVTHPIAHVNGILRGSFYITVNESTYVTCTGGPKWTAPDGIKYNLRAITDYKEEPWLGKPHFAMDGVIHIFDEKDDWESWTKVKHVPKSKVVATISGSWKHLIKYKLNPDFFPKSKSKVPTDDWIPLIDLSALYPIPKMVRDLERQEPRESRKLWEGVTERLLRKEYGEANKIKYAIEQRQREEEAARRAKNEKFVPKYFQPDIDSGMPQLTEEGKKALEEELKETATHPLEQ